MKRILALTCVLVLSVSTSASAVVFFTDGFDYADGDLTAVSGGSWTNHSGGGTDIQVVSGDAVVTAPVGAEDDNRLTGVIMGANDIWYYATNFSVELGTGATINNDYFIHFKNETTFGFNARLALDDPTDAVNKDFSLSIWASSEGDGQADWAGDFDFGEEITAVVGWNNGTGDATLWVNPTDMSSTSIVDTELLDAMRDTESVALRQDSGSSSVVSVDVISVGTTFDEVFAAVGGGGGSNADADSDTDVDGRDFLLLQRDSVGDIPTWEAEFGTGVGPLAGVSAVPEPASVVLLGLSLGLLSSTMRSRREV